MVMAHLSFAVLVAASVGLASCQDARTVNPYPGNWRIDDFEAADGFPFDHSFERWGCRPLDGEHPINADGCNRQFDPGSSDKDPSYVLHLGAALYPYENPDTFTRAEVATYVPDARHLDLRPYRSFSFSWKLVLDSTAPDSLGGPLYLKPELSCTTARDGDSAVPEKPFVVYPNDITKEDSEWHKFNLDILSFAYPENANPPKDPNWRQECLSRVDGIRITVDSDAKVQQNHIVKFNLYVDDINLQPKE
jgi:hypothetical protein